jgi:hypothetical protein
MGVPIWKVNDARDIMAALTKTQFARKSLTPPPYAKKIYDNSSWSSNVGKWIDLYRPPTEVVDMTGIVNYRVGNVRS